MASRMESTGQPEMIQMSECSKDLLDKYYPEYKTTLRGTVEVKGKGACTTYWLDGRNKTTVLDEELQKAALTQLGIS
uniref:Guanylate cyclase domain-containing protein n=1 Tax=Heterorhabditis bacteriophora TaxID=37862 RepID=A0A1I7WIW3_HETBA